MPASNQEAEMKLTALEFLELDAHRLGRGLFQLLDAPGQIANLRNQTMRHEVNARSRSSNPSDASESFVKPASQPTRASRSPDPAAPCSHQPRTTISTGHGNDATEHKRVALKLNQQRKQKDSHGAFDAVHLVARRVQHLQSVTVSAQNNIQSLKRSPAE